MTNYNDENGSQDESSGRQNAVIGKEFRLHDKCFELDTEGFKYAAAKCRRTGMLFRHITCVCVLLLWFEYVYLLKFIGNENILGRVIYMPNDGKQRSTVLHWCI